MLLFLFLIVNGPMLILSIIGVFAIATGKLPSWIIGGGKYVIEGSTVRLLGLLFLTPFPIARYLSDILKLDVVFCVQPPYIALVLLISNIAIRHIRKPLFA